MKLSKAQTAALIALSSWDFAYFDRKAKTPSQRLGLERTMRSLANKGLIYIDGSNYGITMLGQQEVFERTVDTGQAVV